MLSTIDASLRRVMPRQPTVEVTLGPLFPRVPAFYIGALIIMVSWIFPLVYRAQPTNQIIAFLFGLTVLALLFVPRFGSVTVDSESRCMTFRESKLAHLLAPWRRRESRHIDMPTGCTIIIGTWLDRNDFGTYGIKRIGEDGSAAVLIESKFGFDSGAFARLVAAAQQVEGVAVRRVRLGPNFELVDWTPPSSRSSWR